ncbi:dihydrofolate reductase family protein [Nocardioides dongkuii]|uniref:dihydrofolate reductase family protein n=1 Tax=Nocardioides dongkuii TaxID=2760089 RepID=UPI0015FB1BFF|nr:dihydrofolate reductase family protein [Nocardioides dongkuii]
MTTTYYVATTLDGFIADEHDSLDWLLSQEQDEDGALGYDAFLRGIGAIAMGATTYCWVRDHLAESGESWPYDLPCWVFTHRDLEPVGERITFTSDPVPTVHAAMVRAAGDQGVWVVGGGDLAGQHADAGLLDEVVVHVAPVTLGAGRPLLPRPLDLRLVEHGRNGAFACARYEVVGRR